MQSMTKYLLRSACLLLAFSTCLRAETFELKNATTVAVFDSNGLVSLKDMLSGASMNLSTDAWSLAIDDTTLRSSNARPRIDRNSDSEITYNYDLSGYRIVVVYRLDPGWRFVSKQLKLLRVPVSTFTVHRVTPLDVNLKDKVTSVYVPSVYTPQFGTTIEQSRRSLPGKDYGAFLRLPDKTGVMFVVQNPYLDVAHREQSTTLTYSPEMQWQQAWGEFISDMACIGPYRLSDQRLPREMVAEWHLPPATMLDDGMDRTEIAAFTDCVSKFLIDPAPSPISVEVGWTLNDYQIDVGTSEGEAEYKRVIDMVSQLGIQALLYAPGNSRLAERTQSTDSWSWEYVLWLNLG